jgi:hypothetical protein
LRKFKLNPPLFSTANVLAKESFSDFTNGEMWPGIRFVGRFGSYGHHHFSAHFGPLTTTGLNMPRLDTLPFHIKVVPTNAQAFVHSFQFVIPTQVSKHCEVIEFMPGQISEVLMLH